MAQYTKSQAGLVGCLEPGVEEQIHESSGYANLFNHGGRSPGPVALHRCSYPFLVLSICFSVSVSAPLHRNEWVMQETARIYEIPQQTML